MESPSLSQDWWMAFRFCVDLGDLCIKTQPCVFPYTSCQNHPSQKLWHLVINKHWTNNSVKCADDLLSDRRIRSQWWLSNGE